MSREPSARYSEGRDCWAATEEVAMNKAWAGVDAGKEFHWAHVLDASGRELLSRKVENDEADLLKLIDDALLLAEELVWAVDQPGGGAALLLALLLERNQRVLYVPGLTVDRARDAYRGESKTDARDAHLIADQSRMRSDLSELKPGEQEIAELQLLLARRRDLIIDQSRTITRLREALLALFPALERALDLKQQRSLDPPHSLPESHPAQTSWAQTRCHLP
jgi:transposase